MKLRYDPYQVFRFSKTPVGLYARQKWLGEAETPQWKIDFKETVVALTADQLTDGSWRGATVETIHRLFGLHLTMRSSTAQIDTALAWILDKIAFQEEGIHAHAEDISTILKIEGLPFTPSRPDMFLTGAALFLSTIFGRQSDPDVLALYKLLSSEGIKNQGRWFDEASSHNIFRAMVVHPIFNKDKATIMATENLAELQTDTGFWSKDLPFYQTLNSLAHLDLHQADEQLENGFVLLLKNQNIDGTWSKSEPEWNTFLAIHALKNKGLL
jgi:hypothetical protein